MWSDNKPASIDAPLYAIEAHGLGKRYGLYEHTGDRLKQLLWGRWRQYSREFWALRDVDITIRPGEVVGLVGRNGAGKSTLLQMLCGTLPPSTGTLQVNGRVAALLELGAGFNPEFTGIENVYMNAAILGLKRQEVEQRLDDILAFADIGDFARQPVKTYSSGMFVRLAFAVATSVEPDILVIDEALAVGDGAFARKSFDRIMRMKDAGKTILFCSHSMYQVEALCSRALWIDKGTLRLEGSAAEVTGAYGASLLGSDARPDKNGATPLATERARQAGSGTGRIVRAVARTAHEEGAVVHARCNETDVTITVAFEIDPDLPVPGVALGLADASGQTVASVTSVNDGVTLRVDAGGHGSASVILRALPLLKGRYTVTCFLTTEDGVHPYDQVEQCLTLNVTQQGLEQGLVSLPHEWRV